MVGKAKKWAKGQGKKNCSNTLVLNAYGATVILGELSIKEEEVQKDKAEVLVELL